MARRGASRRPSRPGSPRRSEPEGRARRAVEAWELWNLRALQPDAQPEDLRRLHRERDAILAREREALVGLRSGDREILSPGRRYLADHPHAAAGLVVSVHTGPYQLLAEPWLAAGHDPLVLINREALPVFAGGTELMIRNLGLKGRLQWAAVGAPGFMRRVLGAVRDGRPVIVYLDGNSGNGGMAGTRRAGIRYRLPGREIRLRTGVARLAGRLGCAVHPVAMHWSDEGELVWRGDETLRWSRDDDPAAATRRMFDWAFGRILARPAQWRYWSMLKDSSVCFAAPDREEPSVPEGLRDDFARTFAICLESAPDTIRMRLEREVAVWPGGVLVDESADRFYPAAGLRDRDLEPLRRRVPTLTELVAALGEGWVRFHALRLCLLGMARLTG